jgi:hypothetical protein
MTVKLQSHEIPFAYAMLATAARMRPRRDGSHLYQKYYLYWSAFDNIYTTIADRKGISSRIKEDDQGAVVTLPNGNVNIPEVIVVNEREKLDIAIAELDANLMHVLITHQGTRFFLNRIPYWRGAEIEFDAFGQRVNGIINVNYTSDRQYPVWSPIDIQFYQDYLENPGDQDNKRFLARQIVDLLYTVRLNLMQGSRKLDDANDINVIENALPLLELIVISFTR